MCPQVLKNKYNHVVCECLLYVFGTHYVGMRTASPIDSANKSIIFRYKELLYQLGENHQPESVTI